MDLKQVEYFVKCAETESFSKAAELLYTTQPSVSRVIKSLEEELNQELFSRDNKGIRLTAEGMQIYKHACRILESMERMTHPTDRKPVETLRISSNPSSWAANRFLDFYQEHRNSPYHYEISSLGTREIVERVQNRVDDLGLVFVMRRQLPAFQYYLKRNYLEFEMLTVLDAAVSYGSQIAEEEEAPIDFKTMRLIQRFSEEYAPENYWDIRDPEGNSAAEAETVVTTNSDYIMQKMLSQTDLVNISGAFPKGEKGELHRYTLPEEENQILLGGLKRIGEPLSGGILEFWIFLKQNV